MKLVHAADLHLDSALRGLSRYESAPADEIRGATRRALENLVALCVEEQAELLLIAGDLFDGEWRDVSTGLFFVRQLAKLVEAGTRVVWIRGNHDAASRIRQHLRLPEGVFELGVQRAETRVFEDLGVAVHGRGFPRRDVTEDLSAAYPARVAGALNVGLLHTALEGRAGHDAYAPCRADALVAKGYEYWALGHVHQREIVAVDPYVVFPGNLQGRHAREVGEKGAMLIHAEGDRITAVEPRTLDAVRWADVAVAAEGLASVDDVLGSAQAELTRAAEAAQGRLLAARVRVTGASPAHGALRAAQERFRDELCQLGFGIGGAGVWVEKVVLETRVEARGARVTDEALGEVERLLLDLGEQPAADLSQQVFGELLKKLPAELVEALPALSGRDPEAFRELVEDVRSLLFERLTEDVR